MTVPDRVVAGIDPHADTIHVAVITTTGKPVTDQELPTTPDGYRQAVTFVTAAGVVERVGVEGAAGYGAGVSRAMRAAGIDVVEVARPTRADRRRAGKSDLLDAYHAARSVLAGRLSPVKDPTIDGLRALHLARRSAVKARTCHHEPDRVVVGDGARSGPGEVPPPEGRTPGHRGDPCPEPARTDSRRHPHSVEDAGRAAPPPDRPDRPTHHPNRSPGHRHPPRAAGRLRGRPRHRRPAADHRRQQPRPAHQRGLLRRALRVAPVSASSGKTTRHRLSRGGDRAANNALYRIALVRMSNHAPTKAYVAHQTSRGRGKLEIIRMLKRAIVREIYRLLTQPVTVPDYSDLRPARQAKNITLTAVAQQFGLWPTTISRLERGHQRDDTLAQHYRDWLLIA